MVAQGDPLALFWDTDDEVEDVDMAGSGAFAPGRSGQVHFEPPQVGYSLLQSSVAVRDAVVGQPRHQHESAGARTGSAELLDWNDEGGEDDFDDFDDYDFGARPAPTGGGADARRAPQVRRGHRIDRHRVIRTRITSQTLCRSQASSGRCTLRDVR